MYTYALQQHKLYSWIKEKAYINDEMILSFLPMWLEHNLPLLPVFSFIHWENKNGDIGPWLEPPFLWQFRAVFFLMDTMAENIMPAITQDSYLKNLLLAGFCLQHNNFKLSPLQKCIWLFTVFWYYNSIRQMVND